MRSIYLTGSLNDVVHLKYHALIEDLDRDALSLVSLISFGTGCFFPLKADTVGKQRNEQKIKFCANTWMRGP